VQQIGVVCLLLASSRVGCAAGAQVFFFVSYAASLMMGSALLELSLLALGGCIILRSAMTAGLHELLLPLAAQQADVLLSKQQGHVPLSQSAALHWSVSPHNAM
jgi:hypothetical protein